LDPDRVGGRRRDNVDLRQLLELAGQSVIGVVVIVDGVALFRHAAALADLSLAGFEQALSNWSRAPR